MGVVAALTADLRDITVFENTTGSPVISSDYARTGTYSYKLSTSDVVEKTVPDSDTYYLTYAVYAVTDPCSHWLRFREGTTIHIEIEFNWAASGLSWARIKRGGTTLFYGMPLAPGSGLSSWIVYQVYVKIDDVAGEVTFKVGENTLATLTGLDTQNGGTGIIDNIKFEGSNYSGRVVYMDDIVVRDDKFAGRNHLYLLTPNADGTDVAWTASAGNRYDCVSDNPPDDFTDYIYATGDAEKSTFTAAALSDKWYGDRSLVGVSSLAKYDTLSAATIRGIIENNANYSNGATTSLDATGVWVHHFADNDPDGGGDWTETDVNAAEFGVETVTLTA